MQRAVSSGTRFDAREEAYGPVIVQHTLSLPDPNIRATAARDRCAASQGEDQGRSPHPPVEQLDEHNPLIPRKDRIHWGRKLLFPPFSFLVRFQSLTSSHETCFIWQSPPPLGAVDVWCARVPHCARHNQSLQGAQMCPGCPERHKQQCQKGIALVGTAFTFHGAAGRSPSPLAGSATNPLR